MTERSWAVAALLAALVAPASGAGYRVGAKLVKADLARPAERPVVRVLDQPERWRLVEEEGLTGENGREFYFTLEASEKLPPPRVEVAWPKVAIARVLGAQGSVETRPEGTRFRLHQAGAPTGVRTAVPSGRNVNTLIFHNWEVRRAGPYRGGDWPATAIAAQLNYLFAAREAARLMGLADAPDPGFVGDVRLYGFETNYPNRHEDHPPHFHIMLAWPGWTNTQVSHFRLDSSGRIVTNDFQVDDGTKVTSRKYAVGEVCELKDRDGRVGFALTVVDDGWGVVWSWPGSPARWRLGGAQPAQEVSVARQDSPGGAWQPVCAVAATDDASTGAMAVTVTPTNGAARTERLPYDPDTGQAR